MGVLVYLPLRKPHLSVILPGLGLHEVFAAFFYACLRYLHCADLAGHWFLYWWFHPYPQHSLPLVSDKFGCPLA